MYDVMNEWKIGTHFKKENIFLATVVVSNEETMNNLKSKMGRKMPDVQLGNKKVSSGHFSSFLEAMVNRGIIAYEEVDIFYKDEKGYTRFVEEGPETFVGDNSDGKGFIKNVVSVWDYYAEDELIEIEVNNAFIGIADKVLEPLKKYNEDYNKCK